MRMIDDLRLTKLIFECSDIDLVLLLLRFCGIIFRVFGKIAEAAGDFQHLRDLECTGAFQIFQMFFALIKLFLRQPNFSHFCSPYCFPFGINSL